MRAIRVGLLSLFLMGLPQTLWAVNSEASDQASSSSATSQSCSSLFEKPRHQLVIPDKADQVELLPVGYHVMPSLFENGLAGVHDQLDEIGQLGRWVWLGPIHEQTTLLHKYVTPEGVRGETPNDTFYWPADHGSVAGLLGGDEALESLVAAGKERGVDFFVDAVIGHYGYVNEGDKIAFNGHEVTLEEISEHIRPDNSVTWFDWNRLENTSDPDEVLALQEMMATKRLHGLPGFIHQHKEVKEHLINSYKRFIDMGVTGFRIDAVLYVDRAFIAEFINELNSYAAEKGQELTFVLELLVNKDDVLRPIMEDILGQIDDKSRVYFLDFPLMYEFRRIHSEPLSYHFDWLLKFIAHRDHSGVPYWRLIPTIINHDFGEVMKDSMDEKIIYALTEFFSFQPSLLFHGSEQTGALASNRQKIGMINPRGDVGQLVNRFNEELDGFRQNPEDFMGTYAHIVERDTLLLEKRMSDRSLFLFIHKNGENVDKTLPWKQEPEINILYQDGQSDLNWGALRQQSGASQGVTIHAAAKSLILFEMKTKP